jgi:hypothetical protein
MKAIVKVLMVFLISVISVNVFGQTTDSSVISKSDLGKETYTVKASCGKCKFGMTGKTCDLAIKFKGRSYYVEGAAIDDFGDAHADDGFCQAVREARVQGEVVNGKFVATYFELLPQKKKK